MTRLALLLALLAGTASAAPAPFQKPPRRPAEPRWEIDLGPLAGAPVGGEYTLRLDVRSKSEAGDDIAEFEFRVRDGHVYYSVLWGASHPLRGQYGRRLRSVESLPPAEAVRNALLYETGDYFGVGSGDGVEAHRLRGKPVCNVTIAGYRVDDRFVPVARFRPRKR